jgi:hypothetical protein
LAGAAVLNYDHAGEYLGAAVTTEPVVIMACVTVRNLAQQHSVPLGAYLAQLKGRNGVTSWPAGAPRARGYLTLSTPATVLQAWDDHPNHPADHAAPARFLVSTVGALAGPPALRG